MRSTAHISIKWNVRKFASGILMAAGLIVPAGPALAQTCTVDWNDVPQRIDGFGGGAVFLSPPSLDPVTDANMNTLFGANNACQLGLTLLRVCIDPTTNRAIALLDDQKAVARGTGVLATPWFFWSC